MSKVIYKHHIHVDNALHIASFRGNLEKIQSLLDSISPYKTTFEEETPLHLSVLKGHQSAANIFLKILEIDLTASKNFMKEHKIGGGYETENFVIALGKQQMELVYQKCGEMIVNGSKGEVTALDKCTLILMKENVYSVPDILIFRANNEIQKFTLLSTVVHLSRQNGVISLNVQRTSDRSTVLHSAAARGLTTMVMKLLELGANPYLKDVSCQTAIGAAHSTGEFPTYVEMCRYLNVNMFATKGIVCLPITNAVWEKVEFLIDTLVKLRIENFEESQEQAIRSVLSMKEIVGTFLLSDIGEKCLERYGQFLPEKKVSKIILLLVNNPSGKADIVMQFIRKDYTLVKEKTNRVVQYRTQNTVLHTLVRNGWNNEVREIYREFPRLKSLLFEHKELGLNALIQCIQCGHVELAEFLVREHESEIDRPEHWSQLLIAAAELPGSTDFMKFILDNPLTDPNFVLHGHQYVYTNALFVCLLKGNLEKLKTILESDKITDLNIIKGKFDVTLLLCAICSMNDSKNRVEILDYHSRSSDKFKYLTNDLDTSEDEEETHEQNHGNPRNAIRYAVMNEIFDKLIESHANFKHIDSSFKTLLHHAVSLSNKYVVERLISLGLDPIDPDRNGNIALHYVNDVDILNIFKNHRTFAETIAARNKLGETVLHVYVRSANASVDLCSKLIENGIDADAIDTSGNTPLHNAVANRSVSVCEFLINSNVNINLKNGNGDTAVHIALSTCNYDIVALLLKQPTLNLFTLSKNNKSYLTQLSSIAECNFGKIKESLESRGQEWHRLIELYCNETDNDGVSNLFHSTHNKYLRDLLTGQQHLKVNNEVSKHDNLLLHAVGGDVHFAKFLVDKGLDVNEIDVHLRTPLIEALTVNRDANVEVVQYLIEAGANVNYIGWQGTTPLHVACTFFHLESIRILLEAGGDCSVRDADGKLPFECLPAEYRNIISNIML